MKICPFCEAAGQTSRLTPSVLCTTTLIASSGGHYDEAGKWVRGTNPNWRTRSYSCSRGHSFIARSRDGDPNEIISSSAREQR